MGTLMNTTTAITTSTANLETMVTGGLYPPDIFSLEERKAGYIALHVLGMVYMFVALAIVCDEFFIPALGVVTEKLNVPEDVAGATLMAAGGSAPELCTSFMGVFVAHTNVGIGTIIGSAVFNILFVIGACGLTSKKELELSWWPLSRDIVFYSISLGVLIGAFHDQKIQWWESSLLFLCYLVYVIFMRHNHHFEARARSSALAKTFSSPTVHSIKVPPLKDPDRIRKCLPALVVLHTLDLTETSSIEIHQNVCRMNGVRIQRQREVHKRTITEITEIRQSAEESESSMSAKLRKAAAVTKTVSNPDQKTARERRQEMVRQGAKTSASSPNVRSHAEILELEALAKRKKDQTAEASRLAKKAFHQHPSISMTRASIDEGAETSPEGSNREIDRDFANFCGTQPETTSWETGANGAPPQPTAGVTQASNKATSGVSRKNMGLTLSPRALERATSWTSSRSATSSHFGRHPTTPGTPRRSMLPVLLADTAIEENEEEPEKPLEIRLPEAWYKKMIYFCIFPIIITLWATLPDVRKPSSKKWFVITFAGSIVWIIMYSYFMVWWANQTGETIGLKPEVRTLTICLTGGCLLYIVCLLVMGITVLAAGTSMPDLITSVIVARKGFGDMAISSSVGSNLFDVTVGLPLPWLIASLIRGGEAIRVRSDGLFCSIFLLAVMLLATALSVALCRCKMGKTLGLVLMVLYVLFLTVSCLMETGLMPCVIKTG